MPLNPAAVVVGTDGSSASFNAARWAAYIAEAVGAPIVLVHVMPVLDQPGTAGAGSRFGRSVTRTRVPAELDIVRRTAKVVGTCSATVTAHLFTETVAGSATTVLVEHSRGARMLVVGAETVFGERRTGPTTTGVAARAYCPVAVWRGRAGRPIPRGLPVVAAFDGTAYDLPALTQGFELAEALGTDLTVVRPAVRHGLRGRRYGGPVTAPPSRLIGSVAGPGREHPTVTVHDCTEAGPYGHILVRRSATAQLLVVTGRRAGAGSSPGPLISALLHHSKCPVLICRPG